ncbi:hypothetical protein [Aquimarina algiphila]|uniref:hypothetical protein n=1 Tax=Aquimarina algiphila TaxID=2047982 RepID=UPI00232AF3D3|nr:hypothetical protein [Aquimarina algiphila]
MKKSILFLQKKLKALVIRLRSSSFGFRASDFGHRSSEPRLKTADSRPRTSMSHRAIALFFTLTFLQTLIPYNQLWANNNGPNAPEAASFEPVDATDMVNLLTGDFSYVLPLLNVPSPEGGYPIALSYHAGIAMDQEASWVGLGWNLNPGAINRSVNGFADDYYQEEFNEFFYDRGGSANYYNLSLGYGTPEGNISVGLGFSWGTNKALGGNVNLGFGPEGSPLGGNVSFGTDGASAGIGADFKGGLSFGISASTSGNLGVNGGYSTNGVGISISANTNGSYGVGVSGPAGKNKTLGLNFSISKSGVGVTGSVKKREGNKVVGGGGTGIQLNFSNTIQQGDYTTKQSGYNIPVIVPTPIGTFTASFGKQKIRWFLNKAEKNTISGPLNFNKQISSIFRVDCRANIYGTAQLLESEVANSQELAEQVKARMEMDPENQCATCYCEIVETVEATMDVNEFPLDNENYTSLDENNIIFPNIDNYNVQAQGVSGNLALRYYENASLFSLSKNHSLFSTAYSVDGKTQPTASTTFTFESKPEFYFENEFATYLATQKASFNANLTNSKILDYHSTSNPTGLAKRKTGNYIEYFTYKDLRDLSSSTLYSMGYMPPKQTNNITNPPDDAIAAFTVIGVDGKRYHYSIPVYNHASVTRTIGAVSGKEEKDAYFDKIQDTPYATHWLLTAITGPDYVDTNGDQKVDDNDYGYWVEFDYGKWSEAYAWKIPYGKDYIDSMDEEDVKTRIEGYKDIYYLDQIKTRTHTAIFSKSFRYDAVGHEFKYNSVNWDDAASAFTERFKIPSQQLLKLDRIIVLKNEDAVTLSKGGTSGSTATITFPYPNNTPKNYQYNLWSNIYNTSDIPDQILNKAIKVVDLGYRNSNTSLTQSTPNSLFGGRLSLNSVSFKGKMNKGCIPPYKFDYYNETSFDLEHKNDWGYADTIPWDWSLKSITTPEGGKINVAYESDDFHKPAFHVGRLFASQLQFTFLDVPPPGGANPLSAPEANIRIRIEPDPYDTKANDLKLSDYFNPGKTFFMDLWHSAVHNDNDSGYDRSTVDIRQQQAIITEFNDSQNYMIVEVMASSPYFRDAFLLNNRPFSAKQVEGTSIPFFSYGINEKRPRYDLTWRANGEGHAFSVVFKIIGNKKVFDQKEGDIRVKELAITDGVHTYKTKYQYHQDGFNEDPNHSSYRSSGALSYIPNDENLPIPYAAELPAPKVMYEKVTVISTDAKGIDQGKTQYTFNVLKEKDENAIKFGDFFEIQTHEDEYYSSTTQKNVGIRQTTVHDNLSAIGQLLELKRFNKKGQLISMTSNEYYGRENRPNNQGMDQESFQTYKEIDYIDDVLTDKWLIGSSTRINYAQALKSTATKANNMVTTTTFDRYDEISGTTLETSTLLSDQTEVKSVVIPAYMKYSEMGSKVDNLANKNMLAQTAGSLTQIKVGSVWKTVGAGIETWNRDWTYRNQDGTTHTPTNDAEKIWRKHETYTWKGDIDADGAYVGYTGEFDGFQWGSTTQANPKWIKTSTVNLYDHYSMPLESSDINGNSVATKMGDDETKVIAVANAKYTEMFYSGAEYTIAGSTTDFDGEVKTSGNVIEVADAHTGTHIVRVNGGEGFEVTLPADPDRVGEKSKFKMSVWVRKGQESNVSMRVQGINTPFTTNESVTAGNWTLLNGYIDIPTSQTVVSVQSSGATDMDDFRLLPVASSMTSYVYNQWDELSYILGANNLATQYEYDDTGRLIRTLSETVDATGIVGGLKPTQETEYHYKSGGCTTDGNEVEKTLTIHLGVEIIGLTGRITAEGYNGSGNYSYRWAIGEPGGVNHNLTFGPWNNATTIGLVDELCERIPFIAEVRDNVTGQTASLQTFYLGYCNQDGGPGNGGGEGGDNDNVGIQY